MLTKQMINILYGITQQGDNYRNNSENKHNYIASDRCNVWTCTERQVSFESYSVESDCRDKYVVKKQLIDRLYGINQQGEIFRNVSVNSIELDFRLLMVCMDLNRGVGFFRKS